MSNDSARTPLPIGIVAVFALALWIVGFLATSASASIPTAQLELLNTKQTGRDELPQYQGERYGEGLGLQYEQSRYLGKDGENRFWVVPRSEGRICLATWVAKNGDMAFSCVTNERFAESGVSSMVETAGVHVEGYLVPDSLSAVTLPPGLAEVSGNFVVGDSRGSQGVIKFSTKGASNASVELDLLSTSSPDEE